MSGEPTSERSRWPDRVVIGLTGNIATGKSAVSRMAAERGALVLDADRIVHALLNQDESIQAAVAFAFGDDVRLPDGRIDRPALAGIVFADPVALRDLEAILHPAVRVEILQRIDESQARFVVVEAIKLLEGPLADYCREIWVTDCTPRRQIERLMVCRGMDDETAALRVQAQPPQALKVERADVIIDTNETMAETRNQFDVAWERLTAGASATVPAAPAAPRPSKSPPRELPALELPAEPPPDVIVRRARPSDVPAVLLLMRHVSEGAAAISRADLLLSMSERSYLIGQQATDISTVVGWAADGAVARIERIYIHPEDALIVTAPAVLDEIDRTARELACEAILAFPPTDAPATWLQLLAASGFQRQERERLPRNWQRAAAESQPADTLLLAKDLRGARRT